MHALHTTRARMRRYKVGTGCGLNSDQLHALFWRSCTILKHLHGMTKPRGRFVHYNMQHRFVQTKARRNFTSPRFAWCLHDSALPTPRLLV